MQFNKGVKYSEEHQAFINSEIEDIKISSWCGCVPLVDPDQIRKSSF
jgi:hypothetical protein